MRLVDTSIWIEWLIVAGELAAREQWIVLAKWLARNAGEEKAASGRHWRRNTAGNRTIA
jgi:hypothetical protein